MHVLITEGPTFIGSHLVDSLLSEAHQVTVLDNFDPFYNRAATKRISNRRADIQCGACSKVISSIGQGGAPIMVDDCDCIVHLAARAGVRPLIERSGAGWNTTAAPFEVINLGNNLDIEKRSRLTHQ